MLLLEGGRRAKPIRFNLSRLAETQRMTTRLLFLAMEAAFSFVFWTMHSRKPTHSMLTACPWPLSAFTYRGLCDHSPTHESSQRPWAHSGGA